MNTSAKFVYTYFIEAILNSPKIAGEGDVRRGEDPSRPKEGRRRRRKRKRKDSLEGKPPDPRREGESQGRRKRKGGSEEAPAEPGLLGKEGQEAKRSRRHQGEKSYTPSVRSASGESREQVNDGGYLREWLAKNPGKRLSASQMGNHLLIQIAKSGGDLSTYLRRSLLETDPTEAGERVRNLLPLPLWPDTVNEMVQVLDEDKYKDRAGEWRQIGGGSKAKAGRNVRARGLLVWHGLVVISLNFNATGASKRGLLPDRGGNATSAQERCLQRIWDAVKFFVDQKESAKGMGVPRSFADDWSSELDWRNCELAIH